MGSELNIQMKQFNGTDYDNLFPKTKGSLVEGIYTADETLTDDVKGLYGLGTNATPDEIFRVIYNKFNLIASNLAQISVTVQTTNGNKLQGIIIDNVFDSEGNPVTTNANGVATGFVNAGKVNIGVTQYADITNLQKSIEVSKGQTYNETLSVTPRNFLKITANRNIMFTNNVTRVDVTAVGGGGGGGAGDGDNIERTLGCGGGGGGGYCVVKESVTFTPYLKYQATVGKGGAGGVTNVDVDPRRGKNGGSTSFLGVTAQGGQGGVGGSASEKSWAGEGGNGNGKGGWGTGKRPTTLGSSESGTPGANGTAQGYSSFTATVLYGGGGGGGHTDGSTPFNGGKEYGGKGGVRATKPQAGIGPGGGGGGGPAFRNTFNDSYEPSPGAKGADGCIAIRMHLKST